ncbi:MAG TPA: HAMP domain-containing sensor histidine kinase [Gaiellaceae bacterium]|nr:HAMP domain-containing sensor histidine kinase [Gaiellaceae bacterium]
MARRLVAAFVVAALLAVGLFGALVWATTRSEVSDLVIARNQETARNVAAALADGYAEAGGWSGADLRPARALAAAAGATLLVRDRSGETGPGSGARRGAGLGGMMGPMHGVADGALGAASVHPVTVRGRDVGTATLRFPVAAPAAESALRRTLGRTVLWGGALAAALAVAIGLVVSRRIARPLRRLTATAHAVEGGDRSARVGGTAGPAELGELGRAFDRMADSLEREDDLRRAFAADVAHELRTPVAIAQAELEALCDGVVAPTPERLRSLHDEMLRLGRIVEDVETLAAAESAQFRLSREHVDLAEVAAAAVSALRTQADVADVALATDLRPAVVNGDRARLEQVTRNLVGNALKFTPAGGRVEVLVAAANGDARLVVADTGPGVAVDDRARLFDRFWRGRGAGGTSGSGVGLAVVAELVRAHGGAVAVDDAPSGGARFTVSLPRA